MIQTTLPGTVPEGAAELADAKARLATAEKAARDAEKAMRVAADELAETVASRIDRGLNLPPDVSPLAENYREARRERFAATQDAGTAAREVAEAYLALGGGRAAP